MTRILRMKSTKMTSYVLSILMILMRGARMEVMMRAGQTLPLSRSAVEQPYATTIFTTPSITTPRTTTTVIITEQPEQTGTPKKSPDVSKDQVKCYDSGQVANRGKLISTAHGWCKSNKNKKLEFKYYSGELRAPFSCCDTRDEVVPVEVKYSVELHDGCEWTVDEATCKAEFRKVIDGCDRTTEARKQGGRLVGDCVTWRIDPNAQT
jgi:hypothetical protein